jgi:hypothetical protein
MVKASTNELKNETIENEEFDLSVLFEEDEAVMNPSDPLMSHTGSDQENSNASDLLLLQTDNGKGTASVPYLLVSQRVVDDNDAPEEFNIGNRKVIEDLSELHNNTVNLNETFLHRVHDDYSYIEYAGRSLLHSRGQRRARR